MMRRPARTRVFNPLKKHSTALAVQCGTVTPASRSLDFEAGWQTSDSCIHEPQSPGFLTENWQLFCHFPAFPSAFGAQVSLKMSTGSAKAIISRGYCCAGKANPGSFESCSPNCTARQFGGLLNPTKNGPENTTFTAHLTPTPHLLGGDPTFLNRNLNHLPFHPGVCLPEKRAHRKR